MRKRKSAINHLSPTCCGTEQDSACTGLLCHAGLVFQCRTYAIRRPRDRDRGPAGEDAMLIKHPRADMAASASKPASKGALQRAEAAAAELIGKPALERRRQLLVGIGAVISIAWLGVCALYIQNSVGWRNLWQVLPHELGGFIAGASAPLAFLWLLLLNLWRGTAIRLHAAALHHVLLDLSYPTPEAERRVSALAGALRRQAREMEEAAQSATDKIATLGETMADQQQALITAASGAGEQVALQTKQLAGTLSQSSQVLLAAAEQ